MAAATVLLLHSGPAWGTCAEGAACADTWLWQWILPAVIAGGLAVWVAGPFVVAAVARLRRRTGDRD